MSDPTTFEWAFDRNPWDADTAAATFSTGVYQWLPKASGKGLKKSKTIRVTGYVAEPARVYEKAQELCERLNAEGARAEQPPDWLQKQYSVPRPADVVVERSGNELSGHQVRRIRLKAMKSCLLPHGFCHGAAGTYIRQRERQIHLIDFQPAKFGHEYTVNLGFHYSFLPAFFRGATIDAREYDLLDCAVRARIGGFQPDRRDTWYPYGNDPTELDATFVCNAQECLEVFERWTTMWSEPLWWLRWSDADIRPWHVSLPDLFRALIADELGEQQLAEECLAHHLDQGSSDRALIQVALARIRNGDS